MKTLILFLAIFPAAQAAVPPGLNTQALYNQTNDRDQNVDTMNALVDSSGALQGMINVTNGQVDRAQPFWIKDIEKTDGVVLLEGQGRKVLLMQGQLDRITQEGRLHMTYLANGLTNKYETCELLLKKGSNGFFVQNAYNGQKIASVKIVTWSLGLKTLQGICP